MLKMEIYVLYMVYDNNARLRLPNLELSLYSVRTYLIDFQAPPVSERAPQRAASARMTYQAEPPWYSVDHGPERPAQTSYDSWQTQNHRALRNPVPLPCKKKKTTTGAEETMMLGTTGPLINPFPQDTPMIPIEQGHLTSSMTPSLDEPWMPNSSTPGSTMKIRKLFTSALTTPSTHYMKTMPSMSRDGRSSAGGMQAWPRP
jgi:hypothetical protein